MKKISIILAVVFCIFFGLLGYAIAQLNSPQWWSSYLVKAINGQESIVRGKNIKVREILIDNVDVDLFKGKIHFKGIKVKFKIKKASYFLSLGELNVRELFRLFSKDSWIDVDVLHSVLVSDQLNISEINFNGKVFFNKRLIDRYLGDLSAQRVEINRVQISKINSRLTGDIKKLKFYELQATLYDGLIKSDVLVGFDKEASISINANFTGMSLAALASINPEVLAGMQGFIEGQVQVTSHNAKINAFRARVLAPNGGIIKAALLKDLVKYMPQRQQVEALIAANKSIPIDKAQFESYSFNDEKFASQIKLFSSQLNMDMNITLDVNIEGGLKALMLQTGILTE